MLQTNDVAVPEELQSSIGIIGRFVPPWQNDPFVVLILVMVASDLLLQRTNGESLYVGVKQTPSPSHVFERDLGPERNL